MKEDPNLRERVQRADARRDEYLSRRVAEGDTAQAPKVRERTVEVEEDGPEVKKSRGEAEEDDIPLPTPDGQEDDSREDDDAPGAKRARVASEVGNDPDAPEVEVGGLLMGVLDRKGLKHVNRRGKYDVCEVFSPPRVAPVAKDRGLRGGWSLDIRTADGVTGRRWDLLNPVGRDMAFDLIRRDKPHTVILSPPCTKFCALLRLCKNGVDRKSWVEAVGMVNIAMKIAEMQLDAGRHFIFEHPLTASSWRLPSLKRLRQRAGVCETVLHQCMYGLESKDKEGVAPAKKATRILCSSTAVRDQLSRRCDGNHRHVQLISGRPAAAQEYTPELCRAMVDGVEMEILSTGHRACNAQTGGGHWRPQQRR